MSWRLTGSGIWMRDVDRVLFVLGGLGYTLVTIRVLVSILFGGYVVGLVDEGILMLGMGLLSLAWFVIGGKYEENCSR